MNDVCRFYEEEGPKIFPEYKRNKLISALLRQRVTKGDIKQIALGGKFSDTALKDALHRIFGDAKIADSHNYLCIPSYTITEARPWVFKKAHHDQLRDDKAYYVDVALATSAAPTFFPLSEIDYYDHKQFIDGGVWANNPTLTGLIEALRFFVGEAREYDSVSILSISSLSITGGKPTGLKRQRSFLDWKKELFETSMAGQSFFADYFMQHIQNFGGVKVKYFRVPSADVANQQEDLVQLDVATPNAIQLLKGKGNDMGDVYEKKAEVAAFFQNKKLSKLK